MSTPDSAGPAPGSGTFEPDALARAAAERDDHGLAVLLAVRAEIAPELPEHLLRQCYAIQRQFQFDRDEQLPLVHTRKLIEGYVEREASLEDEDLDQ
jgi:hypothetical protein